MKVTWFDPWHPALGEALEVLPEADSCPHELYSLLIQNPGPTRKRTALITDQGIPVALAAMRQVGRYRWEPITQWIIPGLVFPSRSEYLIPGLEALGVDVSVAWWRMDSAPPSSRLMRSLESAPVHRMRCSDDFEQYWRQTRHLKTVRQKRDRCKEFTPAINLPGSAEWVIRNWDTKWRDDPTTVSTSLLDRIMVAKDLESRGQHHTLVLLDRDNPIAGVTAVVHRNDLVATVICRDPKYDWHGVGFRLLDLLFYFAVENGFDTVDIGGGQEYKKKLAPVSGERWSFRLCPGYLNAAKRVASSAHTAQRHVTNWLKRR